MSILRCFSYCPVSFKSPRSSFVTQRSSPWRAKRDEPKLGCVVNQYTVWHEIFAVFPAIRKNKFAQLKITANIFPAKIYSRVNILQVKFATQKYSKKSCLFNNNLSLSFRNNEILVYCLKICISIARTQ